MLVALIAIFVSVMIVTAGVVLFFRWLYGADTICPKCHQWKYCAKEKSILNTGETNTSVENWAQSCSACGYTNSWYYEIVYDHAKGTKKRTYSKERPDF